VTVELVWNTIGNVDILSYVFQPGWDWHDFYEAKRKADTFLNISSHLIPIIFDFRAAPELPPGMITQMRQATESRHPKGKPLVFIGASPIIQNTYEVVKRMLDGHLEQLTEDIAFFDLEEDAYRYVESNLAIY